VIYCSNLRRNQCRAVSICPIPSARHTCLSVLATMKGPIFDFEKVPFLRARPEYFLGLRPIANNLIAVPKGLKRLSDELQMIKLSRPRRVPGFEERRVDEVTDRNTVNIILAVLDSVAHFIGIKSAVYALSPQLRAWIYEHFQQLMRGGHANLFPRRQGRLDKDLRNRLPIFGDIGYPSALAVSASSRKTTCQSPGFGFSVS
jgi:hypothetical protein